jgi:hypothetical protein
MVSQSSHYLLAGSRNALSPAAVLVIALTVVSSIGCGRAKDERVPVFPVHGQIHFKGHAPNGAFIVLHPKNGATSKAPMPRATVCADGAFAFSTYDGADGAPEGEYVLTVQWNKHVKQGNDVVSGPNVLPPKYASPQTSDIKVTVAAIENQLKPIQLR